MGNHQNLVELITAKRCVVLKQSKDFLLQDRKEHETGKGAW